MKRIMKVAMIFVLGLALSGIALAQGEKAAGKDSAVAKGSLWINGAIGYMAYNVDLHEIDGEDVPSDYNDMDVNVFTLGLEGYYFPIRRLGVGLVGSYLDANVDWENMFEADLSAYRFGFGALFALDNFADSKLYPFVNAAGGWVGGSGKIDPDEGDSEDMHTRGSFWTAGVGVNYAIRENLGIIGRLNYEANYLGDDLDFDLTGWILGVGIVGMF